MAEGECKNLTKRCNKKSRDVKTFLSFLSEESDKLGCHAANIADNQ